MQLLDKQQTRLKHFWWTNFKSILTSSSKIVKLWETNNYKCMWWADIIDNIETFLVKQHHIRTNNINREQQNSKTLRNKQSIGMKWTNAKDWNLYEPTSIWRSKIWTLFPDWWSSCCRRVWVLTEAFLLTEPSTHLDPWTQLHPCRIASFAWVLPSLRLEKMCISKPFVIFVFRS